MTGPMMRGPPAEQADPAEHDRGHGVEQEGGVGGGFGRADPGHQQDGRRARPAVPRSCRRRS